MHTNTLDKTPPKIKLISESFVKPKHEVEASKQPHYLGLVDLMFLSLDPIQKGLVFDTKPKLIQSLLDKLKHSLSLSLVHFYPLAGRFTTEKFHDEHSCLIYVDCSKGPGAKVIHATVDMTVSEVLSSIDVHPLSQDFFDLGDKAVNYDGHTRPLLSIQLTELLNGVFIGFTMNHVAGDGTSLLNFISTLSEIFLHLRDGENNNNNNNISIFIPRQPIYKPFLPDGCDPALKLPYLEPEEFLCRYDPGQFRDRIFHFSIESMAKLKAKANEEQCWTYNISSFQALCGFLWRCVVRARKLDPDIDTSCSMSVNARPRIVPPLSQDQFGNFIVGAQTTCKVGELLSHDLGWAATLVHKSVTAKDDKAIKNFLHMHVKNLSLGQYGSESEFYKPNGVVIAGSARFNMYGPDFGLGRAVAALAGYAGKCDGKVIANPGREGGGSVDLEVCLRPEIMDALELDKEFMSIAS